MSYNARKHTFTKICMVVDKDSEFENLLDEVVVGG
jgi:hypothetical protein